MAKKGAASEICAVVVTYFPDDKAEERLILALDQVDHLVIVDNSLDAAVQKVIKKYALYKSKRVTVIFNEVNNLSTALNLGIRKAKSLNYNWVLLLDDDSYMRSDMIAKMMAAYENYEGETPIGMLTPCMYDRNAKRVLPFIAHRFKAYWVKQSPVNAFKDSVLFTRMMMTMTSGSLIPMKVFEEIGLMDESFVIDYIDNDFTLRMIKKGYLVVAVKGAYLKHTVGDIHKHKIWGAKIYTTNHNATRRYTIYRNRIRTLLRYGFGFPALIIYEIPAILIDFTRVTLFEKDKKAKLCAMIKGFFRGLVMRAKEIPPLT